jgi:hypothetical protein
MEVLNVKINDIPYKVGELCGTICGSVGIRGYSQTIRLSYAGGFR